MEKAVQMRKKKPKFLRQDTYKCSFKNKWRKPRGLHNKIRLNRAGHAAKPSRGYGSPQEQRGLHRSGLVIVTITTLNDVQNLDPKKHGLMISSKLGLRKKVDLLQKLGDKFRIFNVKNVEQFLTDVKSKFEVKKKENKSKKDKRVKSKFEAEKKVESKTKTEEIKDEKNPEMHSEIKQKKLSKKAEAKRK